MKKIVMGIIIINWLFGLTGDQLVQNMEDRVTPKDSKVDIVMTLTNKKGKIRKSSLRSITKDDGAKQIIWFLSPADDKGVSFLKIEHDNKDDEMRIWLPDFKKIRRISASKRSDSFMGSDMSYEDMSNRKANEFIFEIVGSETYNNVTCYLLKSKPKENFPTEYSQHISWVDSILFVPIKEHSYDKMGKLLKEKYFTYTLINEYQILTEIQVKNIQKNHNTILTFNNIELDRGVEDGYFHERYLQRIPK